jgi:hypothetical protein
MGLRVGPLPAVSSDADLLFGAYGYESRSLHAVSTLKAKRRVLFAYDVKVHSEAHVRFTQGRAASKVEILQAETTEQFQNRLRWVLEALPKNPRIVLDISSFDRRRLGHCLVMLQSFLSTLETIELEVVYSPASFSSPEKAMLSPSIEAAPVSDSFRGRVRRSNLPLAAVFGLGYEPHRAIGGFELLEPASAWAFMPGSGDVRYDTALADANRLFLGAFGSDEVLPYSVLDPADAYLRVESLVSTISRDARVVLVPMGPKIFSAICLLIGLGNSPTRPAVWRIGSSQPPVPKDVTALGPVVGLSVFME